MYKKYTNHIDSIILTILTQPKKTSDSWTHPTATSSIFHFGPIQSRFYRFSSKACRSRQKKHARFVTGQRSIPRRREELQRVSKGGVKVVQPVNNSQTARLEAFRKKPFGKMMCFFFFWGGGVVFAYNIQYNKCMSSFGKEENLGWYV